MAMPGDWWQRAACQAADPELFFPVSAAGPAREQIERAKAVCASCEVQRRCLRYALDNHKVHGVWGGTTEDERSTLQHRERPSSAAVGDRRRPARTPDEAEWVACRIGVNVVAAELDSAKRQHSQARG